MTNTFLKESENQEWLEAFATIRKTSFDKILELSGKDGNFTKPFLTKDGSNSEKLRVVWLDNGTTLDDALSKAGRFPGIAKGIVSGRRGLGVRVPEEKFQEVLVKCLGAIEGAKEWSKQGQVLLGLTLTIFKQH